VQLAVWKNFADLKSTYGHLADIYEDDWWIFDIRNKDYRLIAIMIIWKYGATLFTSSKPQHLQRMTNQFQQTNCCEHLWTVRE